MKSSIKKIASEAKNRLKSGYWQELYKSRDEDIERAKQNGVGEEFVHGVYKSRHDGAKREILWGRLYPKVRDIVNREMNGETIINPIGILINKPVFESLDGAGRERYVLDLSMTYLEIRKEIEQEVKLSRLKAKSLD